MKYEIPIDLLTLVGDSADAVYITLPAKYFQEKGSSIYIGIEDPETNEPAILLANTTRRLGKLSLLWTNDDGAAIEASSSVSGDGATEAFLYLRRLRLNIQSFCCYVQKSLHR